MTTGRNDPCPCGSGKKFKKCCLSGRVATGFEAARFHRLDREVQLEMQQLFMKVLKKAALKRAVRAFTGQGELLITPELEAGLFTHWLFYDWTPDADLWRARANVPRDGTLADAFLGRRTRQKLDAELREAAVAVLNTPNGFHEVLETDPGRGLRTREVFLGLELEVEERTASQDLERGDIFYGKVVPWRSSFVLVGVGETPIPPAYKGLLIACRREMREQFGTLLPVHLRTLQDTLLDLYLDIKERLHQASFPRLTNSDGEPLTMHTLRYEIDSPEQAAQALAGLHESSGAGDEPAVAWRRDGGGRVVGAEIDWTRQEDGTGALLNTMLGTIRIDGRRLTVEVNSAQRAEVIKEEIARRLGDGARLEATMVEDVEGALRRMHAEGPAARDLELEEEQRELEENPEVQEMIRQTLERHYHGWVDEPLPALQGRTPREAVGDADGREAVEALLLTFERSPQPGGGYDFNRIRAELGLPLEPR
jgi:hypothetical protein